MSASKRARKASSDLDQASMSPSEEENSESSSESEKTSDQDFTPEKKAVVRAPRRGPLAGRKKKVEVFWFSVLRARLGDTPRASLQGHQPLSVVRVWSLLEEDG
ncbi:hepatoma-derived growth factor-related protein 2-like, partial [Pteropus alecto]|uniref:hepatoma-derived growth factor-related protein 2-like n=1 Tax=Pteropus alecto TaxID=9402 RepID=UPI000D532946